MSLLIKAEHISQRFDDHEVLNDISLEIHSGEILTLIGPNGAGKSTLLRILLKLLTPTGGQVIHKPQLKIGFMPQKIQIDPALPMTVKRFLQLGQDSNQSHWWAFKGMVKSSANDNTVLEKVADELNIRPLLMHPIQKVSGGEMQRILLARALVRQPDLLVLDEPVQGVDLQGQTELYHYINELRKRDQIGVLMVSHDLHIVMKNTDQVLCLNRHICCSGTPQSVSENPEFLAIFGQGAEELALYEHHHDHSQCAVQHGTAPIHTKETD